ncbi:putative permease [Silvibacterium bohemicum]|uniref:Putative permease n=1 Tax=Silvibacterium bohemicum TaxID=1577686 RepID=A0A841JWD9_9BACT|nr:ABC transporter permease [Silvibacterium bohemicum]MBB6143291.1 putative permease [Silvibacterium bohemicum]
MIDSLRRGWNRILAFFHKAPLDGDLDAEMASHLEFAIEENMQRGMAAEEARRRALIRFGGMMQAKEQHRETRGLPWVDVLMQDMRYTFRTLRKDRGFTIVAVLILALGIGANVAVFSVVNTILLRPLPFPQSQQLVWIAPPPQKCGLSCATYSVDAYEEFKAQSRSYQDITGYMAFTSPDNLRLTGRGQPEPATGIEVIGNFFRVLGVQPAMGRLFTAEEARQGAHPVTLLANPYWRRQFAADPNIVGKEIDLNGHPATVVGVLPASFDFGAVFSPGSKVDMIVPLILDDERTWGNIVTLIGRLKPGVSVSQAAADAQMVVPHLCWSAKQPNTCGSYVNKTGVSIEVQTLKDYVGGRLRRSLVVLWCAVGTILLIVCVNLSNLLLARAASRSKEFAMRAALGAGRGRLVRQLLTEALILSGAGALLGLGFASGVIFWLSHQQAIALPLLSSVRIDGVALGWTVVIAATTAILFGLVPGLRMASGNLHETLKDSGAGAGAGRKHERIRTALVIGEVALACVLLVGAGLLLHSFLKVVDIDLGFQPEHSASMKVEYDDSAPTDAAQAEKRGVILGQIAERVSALPGVEAAGFADYLPLGRNRAWGTPTPKGKVYPEGVLHGPLVYVIGPGYMRAMGMRLHGRDFTWSDGPNSQRVIMINASAARVYWPGEDAVGKILQANGGDCVVVGVVDDVHADSVEGDPGWQIYYPITQQGPNAAQLVIRSAVPPAALAGTVLHTLRELNPNQPAAEFRPIAQVVDRAVSPRKFFVVLVASFAGLGLLLASLGIYGVISYSVTQQTKEIGIRMALGATTGRVQLGVIRKTLALAAMGIFLGGLVSLGLARMIESLLYGTAPTDPITFAAMTVLLALVAFVAGYVPARRASRIDPLVALRNN